MVKLTEQQIREIERAANNDRRVELFLDQKRRTYRVFEVSRKDISRRVSDDPERVAL